MKSEHRHELKTNELADWIAHFPEWASQNRNTLIAAAAILLVAVLVYFWRYYRQDIVSVRRQTRLTNLVWQVQQQTNNVARAAMQNDDQSYVLLPVAKDLEDFAQSTSDNDVAALALLERADALRAELHYRLADISPEELNKQIGQARESCQQALDRARSNPTLAAMAQFELGLCEEDLGNFDKAGAIYREVAQKPEYAGTTAQAAAAYRLQIMGDFKTDVVFKPAPPPQASKPPIPTIQIKPGDTNAPTAVQVPANPSIGPVAPSAAPAPNQAPAPVGPAQPAEANKPAGG
jgi:tetratricopeptide (TPR) repeat protein